MVKQVVESIAPEWAARIDSAVTLAPTPSAPRRLNTLDIDVDIDVSDAAEPARPIWRRPWVWAAGGAVVVLLGVTYPQWSARKSLGRVEATAKVNSERAQAYRQTGLTAMDEGKYGEAAKAFASAAELEPLGDAAELAKMARDLEVQSQKSRRHTNSDNR